MGFGMGLGPNGEPYSGALQSAATLTDSMTAKINKLENEMPQLKIKEYMEKLTEDFKEISFMPLDDVWERELGDLFDDIEDQTS